MAHYINCVCDKIDKLIVGCKHTSFQEKNNYPNLLIVLLILIMPGINKQRNELQCLLR